MTNEPKRLADEDPAFARLFASSETDGPSPAQVDEAVSLARRLVSTSRWRPWRWLGSGSAVVGVSVLGLFAVTSHSSRMSAASSADTATVVLASPAPPPPAPANDPPAMRASELPAAADEASPSPDDRATPAAPSATAARVNAIAPRVRPSGSGASADRNENAVVTAAGRAEPSTFDEELALLSAARSGLDKRDIPACLGAVERYESRFRTGLFAQEIEVIRIDALATSGERARAHALAERFLAANPTSTYAARVRSLAERTSD